MITDIEFFGGKKFFGAIGMENIKKPLPPKKEKETAVPAYHVLSTKPYFALKREEPLALKDHAYKTAVLSALMWKRNNGPIYLVTDKAGEEYAKASGLNRYYDEVLCLIDEGLGINYGRYWAAGKIEALKKLPAPLVILDMDMVIWEHIDLSKSRLTCAHMEHLYKETYPDFSFFNMSKRYSFDENWDRSAEPLNTAFLYIADEDLKEYYTKNSIRFMQFERDSVDDGVKCMVFAEQRMLSMCAKALGVEADVLLDIDELMNGQSVLTHIWSGKRILNENKDIREKYLRFCSEKIDLLEKA
ncbi:MAG: hypothetical protein E7334_04680 [Clostridiales bacterium]|nr:hypothetical protein [Clostridiales bacterium]